MSHLYFHIPFCKQACHYCDFHFSTSVKNKAEMIKAMMTELNMRKNELPGKELSTIYFGGGTPSLLSGDDLNLIFENIAGHFSVHVNAEITLESNPDDLTENYLRELAKTPVNRLSIGIQSFRDEDLQMMNRAHTSAEAQAAVKLAQDSGFSNITVDLIYGIPGLSSADWQRNLETVNALDVQHLSSYCLTIEPRTALADFVRKGKAKPVNEEDAARHFEQLMDFASANGFDHYEISNFAKGNVIAKHNSSYWFNEPYLGIGPSAHSYHQKTRRWNISNNAIYLKNIAENKMSFQEEVLTDKEQFNELVMTRLRTKWGIDADEILSSFGADVHSGFSASIQKWIDSGHLKASNGNISTTQSGKLLADQIASDLFLV